MADLEVQIGARKYRVACEDGQEPHLEAVAARLRQEADALLSQFSNLSETRLLLMSGLLVADRLRAVEAQGKEASRLSAKLGEVEAREQALEAEKSRLSADLAETMLEMERLRVDAERAASARDRLQDELEALKSGAAGGADAARLEALEKENARLRAGEPEAAAAAEIAALRDRIAAAEHRNALLSDQIEASEAEIDGLKARAQAAEARAEAGGDPADAAEAARALEEATRRIRVLIGDIEEGAGG
ncbi:cell division protein ZapA [Rhodovulum sp. DZ06]|uniref:cell division protein ZapA n=1 Tax=Rhodovulum sp. DZ06 TaxID=3425126 RepID=UPI003D32D943